MYLTKEINTAKKVKERKKKKVEKKSGHLKMIPVKLILKTQCTLNDSMCSVTQLVVTVVNRCISVKFQASEAEVQCRENSSISAASIK